MEQIKALIVRHARSQHRNLVRAMKWGVEGTPEFRAERSFHGRVIGGMLRAYEVCVDYETYLRLSDLVHVATYSESEREVDNGYTYKGGETR